MKPSRAIKTWLRTRQFRRLLHSVPVLMAFVAAVFVVICLDRWRFTEANGRYALMSDRALAAKDFETSRIASRRCGATGRFLFD